MRQASEAVKLFQATSKCQRVSRFARDLLQATAMAEGGSSAERDALRPPKDDPDLVPQMKHYDEGKKLAAGGFGTVHDGLHLGSNTRMAIKKLPSPDGLPQIPRVTW